MGCDSQRSLAYAGLGRGDGGRAKAEAQDYSVTQQSVISSVEVQKVLFS